MEKPIDTKRMFVFLFVLSMASVAGMQGWSTLINNFAVERAGLGGFEMGWVQSIREIPGFLSLLVTYLLLVVSEHRLAGLSILVLGLGLAATGFFPSFAGVALTTLVMSWGFHYYETANQSLALQYFSLREAPVFLGRVRSATAITSIVAGVVILLASRWLDYRAMYAGLGGVIALAGLWALTQDPTDRNAPAQRRKMIVRRRYWLYYLLTFLAGARRQILLAFAIFLLVKKFGFSVQEITALAILNSAIIAVLSRRIGWCINRFGERAMLRVEYSLVTLVFLTYAYVDAKWLVALMYVLDQVFLSFAICINTYFQKVADPADIAPSMAVGFTINHVAAVVIPAVGGGLWLYDQRLVFLAGAVLSLCSLAALGFMRAPAESASGVVAKAGA